MFRSFSSVKCVFFVARPMKIVTFLPKNDYSPKRFVDSPRERDTFRNKILEIVEDFDEKSYNNNGTPWKSSRILRVSPHFFIFLSFSSFFSIFHCFHFFICFPFFSFFSFFQFSFFIFPLIFFLSFSLSFCFLFLFLFFIFIHFRSFSFLFLSFSFSLLGAQNLIFFWASMSLGFLLTVLM